MSYAALFDTWWLQEPGNEELARELTALSEQAWDSADAGDRDALMRFVWLRRDASLFHYLIGALECEDRGLEGQAIGYIGALVMEGYSFSSDDRAVIARFRRRDSNFESLAEYVLELLEEGDNARSGD